MTNYNKVQFIAWEIHTGPVRYMRTDSGFQYSAFDYAGIRLGGGDRRIDVFSQCIDIDARVAFTEKAILKALDKADKSESTLKVFMGPEFLYRGAGGAYLHDLLNGWESSQLPAPYDTAWPGLFGGLKNIVAKDDFKDWVFVFGTAVSASFMTKSAGTIYEIDTAKPAECYNTALIQLGGTGNRNVCYASRKHLKSSIDFINYYLGANVHTDGTIFPLDPNNMIPLGIIGESEGSAAFVLAGVNHEDGKPIKFGIEVCLDHAAAAIYKELRNRSVAYPGGGRLKYSGQYVDIQLVPSGGMTLQENSVCLLPATGDKLKSYAFNCDGLTNFNNAYFDFGAHVQIWNQSNGSQIRPENRLITVSNDFSNINPDTQIRVDDRITLRGVEIVDTLLWNSSVYPFSDDPLYKIIGCYEPPKGSGYVQVFDALDLLPASSL